MQRGVARSRAPRRDDVRPVEQRLDTTQVRITEHGIRLVHAKLRFALPPELDLMAQLAGLTLEARWATFDKQPFTDASALPRFRLSRMI